MKPHIYKLGKSWMITYAAGTNPDLVIAASIWVNSRNDA